MVQKGAHGLIDAHFARLSTVSVDSKPPTAGSNQLGGLLAFNSRWCSNEGSQVMTLGWRHDRMGLGGLADADIELVGIDLVGLDVHHAHARDLDVENVVVDQKLSLVLDRRLRVIGSHPKMLGNRFEIDSEP